MHRIDHSTRQRDKFGAGKDGFSPGDPEAQVPATVVSASWFDSVQEEIANVVEAAGIALSPSNNAQLLAAIDALIPEPPEPPPPYVPPTYAPTFTRTITSGEFGYTKVAGSVILPEWDQMADMWQVPVGAFLVHAPVLPPAARVTLVELTGIRCNLDVKTIELLSNGSQQVATPGGAASGGALGWVTAFSGNLQLAANKRLSLQAYGAGPGVGWLAAVRITCAMDDVLPRYF